MRILQLTIVLGAIAISTCAPLSSEQSPAAYEPSIDIDATPSGEIREQVADIAPASSDDEIREKLAEILSAPSSDDEIREKLADTASLESSDEERYLQLKEVDTNDVLNAEFASDLHTDDEDEIKARFWFWDKKPLKKKPIVHGAEALGHKPHNIHGGAKPGIIKPIIDHIKKPITAILNKPAEIVDHILNKPHKIVAKPGIIDHIGETVEAIVHKPVEIAAEILNKPHQDEYENNGQLYQTPSIIDNIKRPIESLLHKPTISEDWNNPHDSTILDLDDHIEAINKPISDFLNKPNHPVHEAPSIIDHIKKPFEGLLNKPAEIAAAVFSPSHNPEIFDKPSIIDHIKKPIEAVFNKPAVIASHVLNKPHGSGHHGNSDFGLHTSALNKPSIFDNIKKPIEAVLNKPVEIASQVLNNPHASIHHGDSHLDLHISKPSIIDTIKRPFEGLFNKPAEIVSGILNKPQKPFHSQPDDDIIHFPIVDDEEPFFPYYLDYYKKPSFPNNPQGGFFAGLHRFQPNFGFVNSGFESAHPVNVQSDAHKRPVERPSQHRPWTSQWEIPFHQQPHVSQPTSWSNRPWKITALPHSANYGIPNVPFIRELETESDSDESDETYGRFSFNPYERANDFMFV